MYEMNINFKFQEKVRPTLSQPVKRVMDYLQLESHHWSLGCCVLSLPFLLLYSVVSCNYFLHDEIFNTKQRLQSIIV
jgi:hypothetical protein